MTMFLDLMDTWGRPVLIKVSVHRERIDLWCRDELAGSADRETLRRWLQAPEGVFAYDDLAWLRTGDGVALAIDDEVPAWPLADHVLAALRERL